MNLAELAPRVHHLVNLRDVSSSVAGLRPGVLFRSEAPAADDENPAGMPWPPATVVDLRWSDEIDGSHPLAGVAAVVNMPVEDPALGSLQGVIGIVAQGGLNQLYGTLVDLAPRPIIDLVAVVAHHPTPVLVHCAAGKDRTGIAIALILRLLGVDHEHVIADYVRTEPALPQILPRLASAQMLARGMSADQADGYLRTLGTLPAEPFQAPAGAIEAVIDRWDAAPGGTAGWYLENGGDDETLRRLLDRLLAIPEKYPTTASAAVAR